MEQTVKRKFNGFGKDGNIVLPSQESINAINNDFLGKVFFNRVNLGENKGISIDLYLFLDGEYSIDIAIHNLPDEDELYQKTTKVAAGEVLETMVS